MIQRLAVVLSEAAIADLEAVAAYVLDSGGRERAANGFVDRIRSAAKLSETPRAAVVCAKT